MTSTVIHVHDAQPIIGSNAEDRQAVTVTVTRTQAGDVAVLLTPEAAGQLAQILQRHEALTTAAAAGDIVARPTNPRMPALQPLPGYDERLWFHATVDLITAKAVVTHAADLPEPVYVPLRSMDDAFLAEIDAVLEEA